MIKKILSIASILVASNTFSQITITSADMPNANDSIVLSTANIAGVTVAPGGVGMIWDYSTLVPTLQRYDKYDSPFTFTAPFNLLFNPTNTSYGRDNYQFTSVSLPGLTLTDAYDFIKETSSQLKQVGIGYTMNGTPVPFTYSSADIIYKFPMNYADVDSCVYKFGLPFPIPSLGYFGETGTRHTTVDGWGDITTPFGTFNALKITSVIDAVDTIYASSFGFGTNIPRPRRYEYKWLANGMKSPVLQINATEIGGTPVINDIQFVDSLRSDVPHVGVTEMNTDNPINVYPNPASNYVIVSTLNAEKGSIIISTILGEVVYEENFNGIQNKIDIENFSNGIYFVTLKTKNKGSTQKLIISK